MSLESGKKLGFAASIINIVVPLIIGIILIVFYATVFSALFSGISSGVPVTPNFSGVLLAVLVIAIAGGILSLVGYILFLIAMNRFAHYYNDNSIFSNLIKALLIQIVTGVVLAVIIVAVVFLSIGGLFAASTSTGNAPTVVFSLIAFYAIVGIAGFIISIYCAVLYKRSFDHLAEKSGVDNFRTTGLLYLIGTVLNIAGIGSIIVWIGWIFAATGFRKLQPLPAAPAPFVPPYQTGTPAVKLCPACGTENSPDSAYCRSCGRQL